MSVDRPEQDLDRFRTVAEADSSAAAATSAFDGGNTPDRTSTQGQLAVEAAMVPDIVTPSANQSEAGHTALRETVNLIGILQANGNQELVDDGQTDDYTTEQSSTHRAGVGTTTQLGQAAVDRTTSPSPQQTAETKTLAVLNRTAPTSGDFPAAAATARSVDPAGTPDNIAKPDAPIDNGDTRDVSRPESTARVEADEAERLFDDISDRIMAVADSSGHASLTSAEVASNGHGPVDIRIHNGLDPLRHPDILHVDFGQQAQAVDGQTNEGSSPRDWVQLRRETDGRVTVITSADVASAEANPDGSFDLPDPTDNPEALGTAFNRLEQLLEDQPADGHSSTLAPEWPAPRITTEQLFTDLDAAIEQVDPNGRGFYVDAGRLGLDATAYDVRVSTTREDGNGEPLAARTTISVTIEATEEGAEHDVTFDLHYTPSDGLVTIDYTNAAALRNLDFINHGEPASGESHDPVTLDDGLRIVTGALGLEDLSNRAIEHGTSPLEQALDMTATDAATGPSDDWWAAGAPDGWTPPAAEATSGSRSEPLYAEAGTTPDSERIVVTDVSDSTPTSDTLRETGLPSEFAGSRVSLLQLTGTFMNGIYERLRERFEESVIKRENSVIQQLTIIQNEYFRIDLLRSTVGDQPTEYHLRSAISQQAAQILERTEAGQRQRERSAASAIGLRHFMQAVADGHNTRVIARHERQSLRYHRYVAHQRLAAALPHAATVDQVQQIRTAMVHVHRPYARPPQVHTRPHRLAPVGRAVRTAGRHTRVVLEVATYVPTAAHNLFTAFRAVDQPYQGFGRPITHGAVRSGGWTHPGPQTMHTRAARRQAQNARNRANPRVAAAVWQTAQAAKETEEADHDTEPSESSDET